MISHTRADLVEILRAQPSIARDDASLLGWGSAGKSFSCFS